MAINFSRHFILALALAEPANLAQIATIPDTRISAHEIPSP
jgi:hypothetical protein